MALPQLYQSYTTEKIVSFLGAPSEAQSLCNGQWLILPETAICLANVGKEPKTSFFENGSRFCWVADQPYRVNNDTSSYFVPAQVVGPAAKERAIHLFARPRDSTEFLYLGKLEPSYCMVPPRGENHGMAYFELRPALPSALWVRLGGAPLGNLDFTAVDRALDSLRSPTTVEDRLGVLQTLVEFWHGPIRPEDGYSDAELAGISSPMPLRWWYRWAGKRDNIMSGQNRLYKPTKLTVEDNLLHFYIENQGCYQWSTLSNGDDPPVFGREESKDPWTQEGMTLSEQLILTCLFEAVTCHAKYGAWAALDEDKLSEITSKLSRVAIAPWRWINGTEFYAGQGAFLYVSGRTDREWGYMCIGAKTEQPLQFLKPYVSSDWDHVAI